MKTLLLAIMMMLVATNVMAGNDHTVTVHVVSTVYRFEYTSTEVSSWSILTGNDAVINPYHDILITTDKPILLDTCRGKCLMPANSVAFFVEAVDGLYNTHIYGKGTDAYDVNMSGLLASGLLKQ